MFLLLANNASADKGLNLLLQFWDVEDENDCVMKAADTYVPNHVVIPCDGAFLQIVGYNNHDFVLFAVANQFDTLEE